MLIKPIIDKLKEQGYFNEVLFSKDIPQLKDLQESGVNLPVCYMLPVMDKGTAISSDGRPQQTISFTYSFCIVAKAGDFKCIEEPPISEAKQKMLEALLGFSVNEYYGPMAFVQGQLKDTNFKHEIWVQGYQTERTYRKKTS